MKDSTILLLIALVGMVSQVVGECRFNCGNDHCCETLPHDQLLAALRRSTFDPESTSTEGPVRAGAGMKVFELLKEAMDKDVPGVILGEYSVNDLFALNFWNVGECSEEGLEERRKTCEKFSTRDEANHVDSKYYNAESSEATGTEFINTNLGTYCWTIVEDIETRCPLKQLRARINAADLKVLKAFFNKLLVCNKTNPVNRLNPDNRIRGWNVLRYLDKEEPRRVAKLKVTCSFVVEGLGASENTLDPYWRDLLNLCRIISTAQVVNIATFA